MIQLCKSIETEKYCHYVGVDVNDFLKQLNEKGIKIVSTNIVERVESDTYNTGGKFANVYSKTEYHIIYKIKRWEKLLRKYNRYRRYKGGH